MIYYHGSNNPDLQIDLEKNSRYGFKAFFATSEKGIAQLYGQYLYKVTFIGTPLETDFQGEITHSARFKRMIIHHKNYAALLVRNCYDYPIQDKFILLKSDILCVYNLVRIHLERA